MDTKTQPADSPRVESELYRITERSLRAAPPDKDGFVAPRAAGAFDVVVGTASIDRALEAVRILIEQAGHAGVRLTVDAQARKTCIQVGDELLPIRLRDRRRQVKHRLNADERKYPGLGHPRWDLVPSGDLSLQVDAPTARNARRCWALGGTSRLPDQIAKCLRSLPKITEAKKAAAIESERQAREWAERRQREYEEERRRAEERHRRQLLLEEAAAWQQSQALRSYIEGIRARFHMQRDPDQQAKLERWISWASSVVDSMDPVLQAEATTTERAIPGS